MSFCKGSRFSLPLGIWCEQYNGGNDVSFLFDLIFCAMQKLPVHQVDNNLFVVAVAVVIEQIYRTRSILVSQEELRSTDLVASVCVVELWSLSKVLKCVFQVCIDWWFCF